jgi:hypothetical protein
VTRTLTESVEHLARSLDRAAFIVRLNERWRIVRWLHRFAWVRRLTSAWATRDGG